MVIWKYKVEVTSGLQEIRIPAAGEILSVGKVGGELFIWAMVNPESGLRNRYIEVIGTGWNIYTDIGVDRKFIGTVVVDPFVWHVFERR